MWYCRYKTVGQPQGMRGFDHQRQAAIGRKVDLYDRSAMDCKTLTLRKGERLYMPVHAMCQCVCQC